MVWLGIIRRLQIDGNYILEMEEWIRDTRRARFSVSSFTGEVQLCVVNTIRMFCQYTREVTCLRDVIEFGEVVEFRQKDI